MQKLIVRWSALLCCLLLFSCAKDNDLSPTEVPTETLQASERGGPESPCSMHCKKPDYVQVSAVTGCGAAVSWGFEGDYCGTFMVHLQNMTTGVWTVYDPAASPLQLWSLEPCTEYTVGISHVTDICASVPLEVAFETSCESCECNINCKTPDYAFVESVGENRAVVEFGFNDVEQVCGKFIAMLKNNDTGVTSYLDPALSPLALSGLSDCTSYTISLSHVTDLQACIPTELDFTTSCGDGPCDAKGLNSEEAYLDEIHIVQNSIGTVTYLNSFGSTGGYVFITNPVVTLQSNVPVELAFCFSVPGVSYPGDIKVKMWIDFDGDNHFELNELLLDYFYSPATSLCVGLLPALTFPSQEVCGVRGRAILSVDDGELISPCENVLVGNVFDFLVNVGDCKGMN